MVWAFALIVTAISAAITPPPAPEQVTDDLSFNWRKINIGGDLGGVWYRNVTFWWAVSFVIMVVFVIIFGVIL